MRVITQEWLDSLPESIGVIYLDNNELDAETVDRLQNFRGCKIMGLDQRMVHDAYAELSSRAPEVVAISAGAEPSDPSLQT